MECRRYYDTWKSLQIKKIAETDLHSAKKQYETYIEEYPVDYITICQYISLLIALGELDKADVLLNDVKIKVKSDKMITKNVKNYKNILHSVIICEIKLLSYQKRYDELFKFALKNKALLYEMKLNNVFFYCKNKVGDIIQDKREPNSYLYRQMIEYKESDFLEHIQKHLYENNLLAEKTNAVVFSKNFPILDVISEVRKYIPRDEKINEGYYANYYIFKYDNCGYVNQRLVDYFKVICFDATSDMITIYPIEKMENVPYIDLNYMIQKDTKKRTLSQIDKFNRRYNR